MVVFGLTVSAKVSHNRNSNHNNDVIRTSGSSQQGISNNSDNSSHLMKALSQRKRTKRLRHKYSSKRSTSTTESSSTDSDANHGNDIMSVTLDDQCQDIASLVSSSWRLSSFRCQVSALLDAALDRHGDPGLGVPAHAMEAHIFDQAGDCGDYLEAAARIVLHVRHVDVKGVASTSSDMSTTDGEADCLISEELVSSTTIA